MFDSKNYGYSIPEKFPVYLIVLDPLSQSNQVPQNDNQEIILYVLIVSILSWTITVITIQALYVSILF